MHATKASPHPLDTTGPMHVKGHSLCLHSAGEVEARNAVLQLHQALYALVQRLAASGYGGGVG